MTVSATASMIYRDAKIKAIISTWDWTAEWSKAMKKAVKQVCTKTNTSHLLRFEIMNKTPLHRGKENDMTEYQAKKQKEFFSSYPAESIRAAERMGKFRAGEMIWMGMRQNEINTLKLSKLKCNQEKDIWH